MSSETQNAPKVHVEVGEISLAQQFSVLLTVCDDVAVSEVRVDATMPAHQHGLNYAPKITALGDGVFRADNMLFHMPGLWELRVDASFGGRSISYNSDVVLK
ncbi:FixH family protein [uncultured Ruegeria sp.]|uniref:FixH family protein n=1 Tax=uncultured Ruegeria sp. TaxID=259304 RepID=UPI002623E54E|nr:FixH family protein [uncultured Ruegeria sp.]